MEILYSDKNIAVCVKPVGLDSEMELPVALKEQLGGLIFPIHRLDKKCGRHHGLRPHKTGSR